MWLGFDMPPIYEVLFERVMCKIVPITQSITVSVETSDARTVILTQT